MIRALVFLSLFVSGCTTAMWETEYEKVEIEGFYVNPKTNDLIVASGDTAYIFPVEKSFANALNLTRKTAFHAFFQDFSVNKMGQVTGVVTLNFIQPNPYTQPAPSQSMLAELDALGFRDDDMPNSLRLSSSLNGKMYTIEGELPLEKLENKYVVWVAQPRTLIEKAGKLVATPVTVAYDTVVAIPSNLLLITALVLGDGSNFYAR
ncbi:hypothetical protein MO867_18710 [Microbulbifer sp. OS29]|uniref:Lipoprotein n=1 Tax=Microbulbifer okhotskensis TaxID=2926617 RepID=A0A9X2EUX6_9GAMM|nr:hypothetical protein [Microbulbifer okhotskensis]MCO1336368.1 hypothetical protein [Microbulbifer okhotskensis]